MSEAGGRGLVLRLYLDPSLPRDELLMQAHRTLYELLGSWLDIESVRAGAGTAELVPAGRGEGRGAAHEWTEEELAELAELLELGERESRAARGGDGASSSALGDSRGSEPNA